MHSRASRRNKSVADCKVKDGKLASAGFFAFAGPRISSKKGDTMQLHVVMGWRCPNCQVSFPSAYAATAHTKGKC